MFHINMAEYKNVDGQTTLLNNYSPSRVGEQTANTSTIYQIFNKYQTFWIPWLYKNLHNEKCNQLCTNMPDIGFVIRVK